MLAFYCVFMSWLSSPWAITPGRKMTQSAFTIRSSMAVVEKDWKQTENWGWGEILVWIWQRWSRCSWDLLDVWRRRHIHRATWSKWLDLHIPPPAMRDELKLVRTGDMKWMFPCAKDCSDNNRIPFVLTMPCASGTIAIQNIYKESRPQKIILCENEHAKNKDYYRLVTGGPQQAMKVRDPTQGALNWACNSTPWNIVKDNHT